MILVMAMTMNGCSTINKSTLLGAATGAVVGAGSGAILSQQEKAQVALTSALIMSAIGGFTGYYAHQGLEKRDGEVRKETL
ncbi:MAG: hypothetical protein K2X47_01405, partial [Bdellovibrionales bacterium]|nr:hypothetical protein [Bdellovibrionales bacterium]